MSTISHVWDALDRRIRQSAQGPANMQQLRTAMEEDRPESTTFFLWG